jgi:hypothetical protein
VGGNVSSANLGRGAALLFISPFHVQGSRANQNEQPCDLLHANPPEPHLPRLLLFRARELPFQATSCRVHQFAGGRGEPFTGS